MMTTMEKKSKEHLRISASFQILLFISTATLFLRSCEAAASGFAVSSRHLLRNDDVLGPWTNAESLPAGLSASDLAADEEVFFVDYPPLSPSPPPDSSPPPPSPDSSPHPPPPHLSPPPPFRYLSPPPPFRYLSPPPPPFLSPPPPLLPSPTYPSPPPPKSDDDDDDDDKRHHHHHPPPPHRNHPPPS